MKYKYIVGLLVALSFSNAFGADVEEPIAHGDYQAMYEAFRCSSVKDINTALQNNQTFNHKDDTDIIRSSQTGLALRKAVIGLETDQLQEVVEENPEFFKTSLGVSLVYGWTLNQFKEPVTPYYIGYFFSFDKLFQGLASKIVDSQVRTFLKSAFTLGLSAVEADRWAFYDHMLYLPYAIEQAKITPAFADDTCDDEAERATEDMSENGDIWKLIEPYTISIDDVVRMSRRTKEEAQAEAKRAPGIAIHLQGDLKATTRKPTDFAESFIEMQKYVIKHPGDCVGIPTRALEIFKSLPADTNEHYEFMGESVSKHCQNFEHAIHVAHDYFVISQKSFMNYEEEKAKYPETTSSDTFVFFKGLIKDYRKRLESKNDIDFLLSQAENEPLHEPSWGWNKSESRRNSISKLLGELRAILKP